VNNSERGFSVTGDGPLDMRMDPQVTVKLSRDFVLSANRQIIEFLFIKKKKISLSFIELNLLFYLESRTTLLWLSWFEASWHFYSTLLKEK
jgi:hypothetical protein